MLGNENSGSGVLDNLKVDSWLRSALEAEGDDFGEGFNPDEPARVEGSITLHLGDGTSRIIQLRSQEHDEYQIVTVTGSSLSYVLSEWTLNRLFRDSAYFMSEALLR